MVSKSDESYCLFGAKALLKRLQDVAKEIDGVRKADDIERIHDMRVATRRVRSAMPLFEKCLPGKSSKKWNREMKRVTQALGTARDADVQIDFLQGSLDSLTDTSYRPGIQRLMLRLQQKREKAQGKVLKAMDRLEMSGVLEQMGGTLRQMRVQARMHHADESSPYVYERAYLAISFRLENMLAYETYVTQPERIEELHAMRIAAKRLRYTMEVFEPLYQDDLKQPIKTARKVQTLLGDIHDCDVWVDYVPQFLEEEQERTLEYFGHARPFGRLKPGILYLRQERQEQREKLYTEFVGFWQELQAQNTWDNLLELISQPLPEPIPDAQQVQA
jgi:CHAD domain-containing protein